MATSGDPSRPQPGTAAGGGGIPAHGVVWTTEEDEILREGLEKHYQNPTLAACEEIAAALPRKTILDVGLRCEWLLVAEKITDLSNYHMLRPLAMSSEGINADRENFLFSSQTWVLDLMRLLMRAKKTMVRREETSLTQLKIF
ncbi:uncharacterized protein LOC120269942 isoform X3 [Dioscorea cayenensis subsp. rotundata]|uniref:Uncharacterized protein LOC120269942 isoform X3 n=1 Tax=Dioscorea cayennensis subsp. rotundata TaxID=55577 RepID=A0AB40BZE0_DIOCR|nr:uncharacterized protein LOC120269942 isoform X3 [Dioscorea cayenensis subsp. rotundata]